MPKDRGIRGENLMNEFEVRDALRERRKNIKTEDELFALIRDVKENYNCGYGEAPRAIAQAAVAVANYLLCEMGCTGFQASCALWDIIRDLIYTDNECGMCLIDYDLMLYPQYAYRFINREINTSTWEELQKKAKKLLVEKDTFVHPDVRKHWQSICDGGVPFGYTVKSETD